MNFLLGAGCELMGPGDPCSGHGLDRTRTLNRRCV
jgi:hypothetical protein